MEPWIGSSNFLTSKTVASARLKTGPLNHQRRQDRFRVIRRAKGERDDINNSHLR